MNSTMIFWAMLPLLSFVVLLMLEKRIPAQTTDQRFSPGDWLMNLAGFGMQGLVIPFAGYWLATSVFPEWLPNLHGILHLGFGGAFLLNFIGIDFLYYWQHRAFHQIPALWKLHAPHHHAPMVNVWVTSRNALLTNFLFVYMLVNPVLGYLCDSSEGFFAGAMVTAAMDLFRHGNIRVHLPALNGLFVLPRDHHRHHDAEKPFANYSANFILWDRLFGTADVEEDYPVVYTSPKPPPLSIQLLYPWRA